MKPTFQDTPGHDTNLRGATLGRSGLAVSRLGLGLAALGRPGYINLGHAEDLAGCTTPGALRDRTHAVLDVAWRSGVRYFDAARSYGLAEEFLHSWLQSRDVAPRAAVVGSKWGYTYVAGWRATAAQHEIKDHSLAALQRQAPESDAILGPHLNLYQVHSATPDSAVLEDPTVLDELRRWRDRGWRIGLTTSGAHQADVVWRMLEATRDGEPLFEVVQATWNVLETSAAPALAAARERGLGIIVKEPLANGRLTERNRDGDFAAARAVLEPMARRHRTSVDAVALAAALAQPWADVVLLGATRVDHLEANLAARSVILEERDARDLSRLATPPEQYWRTRSRMPWS
jgi:aryl-alcohol dehydrogenase-like predicted oxidoreductase